MNRILALFLFTISLSVKSAFCIYVENASLVLITGFEPSVILVKTFETIEDSDSYNCTASIKIKFQVQVNQGSQIVTTFANLNKYGDLTQMPVYSKPCERTKMYY